MRYVLLVIAPLLGGCVGEAASLATWVAADVGTTMVRWIAADVQADQK